MRQNFEHRGSTYTFVPDFTGPVPSSITARLMAVIHYLGSRNRIKAGTKPVRRASLGVTKIDTELHIFGIPGSHGKRRQGKPRPTQSKAAQMNACARENSKWSCVFLAMRCRAYSSLWRTPWNRRRATTSLTAS